MVYGREAGKQYRSRAEKLRKSAGMFRIDGEYTGLLSRAHSFRTVKSSGVDGKVILFKVLLGFSSVRCMKMNPM